MFVLRQNLLILVLSSYRLSKDIKSPQPIRRRICSDAVPIHNFEIWLEQAQDLQVRKGKFDS